MVHSEAPAIWTLRRLLQPREQPMTTFAARQSNRMVTELGSFDPKVSRSNKAVAIALHCSGSSGGQWWALRNRLRLQVITPDLMGCGAMSHWSGEGPFRLSDEAWPIVTLIDELNAPVHLVGHSYGGGVALRIAVERPNRIASLTLYEPTAFHVLKAAGEDGHAALKKIRALAGEIDKYVVAGSYRKAARRFVDYWNGPGTFDSLKRDAQEELIRYVPKSCLEFRALIGEMTPLLAYRNLRIPLLIMCGENASTSTELIARKLATVMNPGSLRIVAGAGHMGPTTHSEAVIQNTIAHIVGSDPAGGCNLAAWVRQAA
jgi:pimeloyl-ACP methyl ester carboxylesterase